MQFRRERVRVETQRHIIEGTLQLPHEGYRSRTTDYLNAHDSDFIALIDADVAGPTARASPSARTTWRSRRATSSSSPSSSRSAWSRSRTPRWACN